MHLFFKNDKHVHFHIEVMSFKRTTFRFRAFIRTERAFDEPVERRRRRREKKNTHWRLNITFVRSSRVSVLSHTSCSMCSSSLYVWRACANFKQLFHCFQCDRLSSHFTSRDSILSFSTWHTFSNSTANSTQPTEASEKSLQNVFTFVCFNCKASRKKFLNHFTGNALNSIATTKKKKM